MKRKNMFDRHGVLFCGSKVAVMVSLIILLSGGMGWSQQTTDYPNKPIDLIIAFPAGGGGDVTARLVSQYFSKKFGQSIRVVNLPGGGAIPGTKQAIESKPDGYTLFIDPLVTAAMMPAVYVNLPFDWTKRTWISLITVEPSFFLVNTKSPYKTLQDLAKAVKENPKKFSWGGTGRAGTATFALGQFFLNIGVNFSDTNMVAMQGSAPALVALAGGHIDIAGASLSEILPLISAGKIRPLAVVSEERLPELPDVPTTKESGFPNLAVRAWQGICGPAGLPQNVVNKWANGLKEAMQDPEFLALAKKMNKRLMFLGPDDFKDFAKKEYEIYLNLAMKMGVRQ